MTGSYDASVHKLVEDVKSDEALLNGNVVHVSINPVTNRILFSC